MTIKNYSTGAENGALFIIDEGKITDLKKLSIEARTLFAEILIAEQVRTDSVENKEGYEELTDENLLNSWHDDTGLELTEVGPQL